MLRSLLNQLVHFALVLALMWISWQVWPPFWLEQRWLVLSLQTSKICHIDSSTHHMGIGKIPWDPISYPNGSAWWASWIPRHIHNKRGNVHQFSRQGTCTRNCLRWGCRSPLSLTCLCKRTCSCGWRASIRLCYGKLMSLHHISHWIAATVPDLSSWQDLDMFHFSPSVHRSL